MNTCHFVDLLWIIPAALVNLKVSCIFMMFSSNTGLYRISCEAHLLVMNSLSFCLSGRCLISPSLLTHWFAIYNILCWNFYSFKKLSISPHSLLAYRVSAKNSDLPWISSPLHVTWQFSLSSSESTGFLWHPTCKFLLWSLDSLVGSLETSNARYIRVQCLSLYYI